MSNEMKDKVQDLRQLGADLLEHAPRPSDIRDQAKDHAAETLGKVEGLPDGAYLAAVLGSMGLSLLLFMLQKRSLGIFVGLWPATLASMAWLMKERHPSKDVKSMI